MARRTGVNSHLVRHNGHPTWHCVQDVPKALQDIIGRKRLVKSLQTHDLIVARSRRPAMLAEFERVLSEARAKSAPSSAVAAGLAWRATFDRVKAGDPGTIAVLNAYGDRWGASGPEGQASEQEIAHNNALMELDTLASELPKGEADVLLDVAYGRATPLLHHVEAWLAEGGAKGPLNPRTAGQYRNDVKRLATWARAARVPETVEAFTKSVAGRYVTETMIRAKVDPSTGNRWISAASAYWRWMGKRAGVEVNPWQGQSLAKSPARSKGGERVKRPFTDGEVGKLLDGSPDAELADLIRVGALSGMRLEEIYRLTVADCAAGWFRVRVSKTNAGVRRVPTHSGLAGIVARRCDSKDPGAFLFHEAGAPRVGRERSMAASKRFGRYRITQGVHERQEGRRSSAVDFHSLRRWFITSARNAGQDRAMVAAVVGHAAGNITDDVYSSGPDDATRRKVVEAVKLPAPAAEDQAP